MAIALLFFSILGVDVFGRAGDIPVMIVFVGLTLIYATEIPMRFFSWNLGGRVTGLFQVITGVWLMLLHVRDDCRSGIGRQSLDLGECGSYLYQ